MLKNTKYPVSSEGLLGQASSLGTPAAKAQDRVTVLTAGMKMLRFHMANTLKATPLMSDQVRTEISLRVYALLLCVLLEVSVKMPSPRPHLS